MSRVIKNVHKGQELRYFDKMYDVLEVYPSIAYLKCQLTSEVICVCLGDLVMAGIESSMVSFIPRHSGNRG